MATSKATTVAGYLAALPPDRREALQAVRKAILDHLPDGFEEIMEYGCISYAVPLSRFPDTYNGRPLSLAGLAAQKGHLALYLMSVYDGPSRKRFEAEWRAAGKKLDMGKACVRFQRAQDLPLDVVGATIGRLGVDEYVERYMKTRPQAARAKARPAAKKKAGPKRRTPAGVK